MSLYGFLRQECGSRSLGIGKGNNIIENLLFLLFFTKVQSTTLTTNYETTKQSISTTEQRENSNISKVQPLQGNVWRGKISIYSATWGGCLGCKKWFTSDGQLYYRMANGEILDDGNFTIAFNYLPLNSRVSLVNRDNARSVAATITDRGGFEECCGRIADLSVAGANALDAKTDHSLIEISKVPNQ